jgi:hypothetical protein
MDDRRDPSQPRQQPKGAKTSEGYDGGGVAIVAPPDPGRQRAVDREGDDRRRPAENDEEGLDEESRSEEQRQALGDQGYSGDHEEDDGGEAPADDPMDGESQFRRDEEAVQPPPIFHERDVLVFEDFEDYYPDRGLNRPFPYYASAHQKRIGRRVVAELRSEQVSLDRLASLFREYDRKCTILWHIGGDHRSVFNLCFDHLSKASMEALIRRAVLDHPRLLSEHGGHNRESLLHMAVLVHRASRAEDRLDLIRLLIELDRRALTVQDHWGMLPIQAACSFRATVRSDVFLPIIQLLVEGNPATVGVRGIVMNDLPLHRLCKDFDRDEPQFLAAVQLLIDHCPLALAVSVSGMTPIMAAIKSLRRPALLLPAKLDFLRQMILRGGPTSLWTDEEEIGDLLFDGERCPTALACVDRDHPHPELVSALVETWPLALCMSFHRGIPNSIAIMVKSEARAVLQALIEVVLHDTTGGAVPAPVRDHIRSVVRRLVAPEDIVAGNSRSSLAVAQRVHAHIRGDAFCQLRSEVLTNGDLQWLLAEREDFRDFLTGLYRMNMAGRLGPEEAGDASRAWGAAVPAEQHARTLAAAGDNLSSLFHHLRDCSLDLFAGFGAAGRGS